MKILLLTDGITPYVIGGMQRHSFFIAKYLLKNDVQLTLYHCVAEGEELVEHERLVELLELNPDESRRFQSKCFYFPKPGKLIGHYLRRSKKYSRNLYDAYIESQEQYNFIYSKGFTGWHFVSERSGGANIPPVGVKLHGLNMYQVSPNWRYGLQARMLRRLSDPLIDNCDVNFSYGGKITDSLKALGVSETRILEIPTGIEEDWVIGQPSKTGDKLQLTFIGRFDRVKGLPELYEGIKQLKEEYKDKWQLTVVGPIPEEHKFKHPNVIFTGGITDKDVMKEILVKSDVLVCPSWSEGMPNVVLEAMASGCAIIATDTGAVAEMVSERNGWLLETPTPENIVMQLGKAISVDKRTIDAMKMASVDSIKNKFVWNRLSKLLITKLEGWLVNR